MMETQVLLSYEHQSNATNSEAACLAKQRRYENMMRNSRIRSNLNDISSTISISDMSFQNFLVTVEVPSNKEYTLAIISSLKRPKEFIQGLPNAVLVSNYLPTIFSLMKSSMDIHFVLDPYACCSYIVDYINQADRCMREALDQVYMQCREGNNTAVFDMLRSLATTYYNASEVSVHEASYSQHLRPQNSRIQCGYSICYDKLAR